MGMTYFKRFRMEIDLSSIPVPAAHLPPDYVWVPWNTTLIERHASAKFESFRDELDRQVFSCFSDLAGCRNLMHEIVQRDRFLPEATWLINFRTDFAEPPAHDCGAIQAVLQPDGIGAIQNVGVTPEHRGLGLGRALVLRSLRGFWELGVRYVYLDVTARNHQAVQLYRSLGFRLTQTSYKVVHSDEEAYA